MAGLINWRKVAIPSISPDTDHAFVGVDLTGKLYLKNDQGVVATYQTSVEVAQAISNALSNYDESSVVDTKISTAISNLINGAGAALDTLNELAAALGNDPNFATTITTQIGNVQTDLNTHKNNTNNPHGTTASQVGAYSKSESDQLINQSITDHKAEVDPHPQYLTETEGNGLYDPKGSANSVQTNLNTHVGNTENPHNTTKTQVGLGNVPNIDATIPSNITQNSSYRFVTDTEKDIWNAKEPAINPGTQSQYYRGDKTFQTVNKAAVGLDQVDNTSDAAKPISSATQTALNAKVDKTTTVNTGAGLQGGGDLSSNRIISLANSGAVAGAYVKPVMPIDQYGRVTSIRAAYKKYIERNTDASTTLNTNQTYLTLSVDVPKAGDYKIFWDAIYRANSNTVSGIVDILLDGVGIYSPEVATLEELSDTGANERIHGSGNVVKTLTVGAHTITLVYRSESAGTTMNMYYGNLMIEEF